MESSAYSSAASSRAVSPISRERSPVFTVSPVKRQIPWQTAWSIVKEIPGTHSTIKSMYQIYNAYKNATRHNDNIRRKEIQEHDENEDVDPVLISYPVYYDINASSKI